MTTKKTSRTATAEKIAVLIRIYRASLVSGDADLRRATEIELASYGIRSADLAELSRGVSVNGGEE
jgi:hypothetical protein